MQTYDTSMFAEMSANNVLTFSGDMTGAKIRYLYVAEQEIVSTESESEFFEYLKQQGKLEFDIGNLSYLIFNNVVPYPFSIYQNVYLLVYGHAANVSIVSRKFTVNFEMNFPYLEQESKHNSIASTQTLLGCLKQAVSQIDTNSSMLSLSSGKDSVSILLAMAEAGNKVETFTYKSPGKGDETLYVSELVKRFGFQNHVVELDAGNSMLFTKNYDDFYASINIPSMDQAQLSYLHTRRGDFEHKNIIDGSGSDIYMGHMPTKQQYFINFFSLANYFPSMADGQTNKALFTGRKYQNLFYKTTAANNGLFTWFTMPELLRIFPQLRDTSPYWVDFEQKHKGTSYINYRAMTAGQFMGNEVFIRKVRNFCLHNQSSAIFPWLNAELINYYFNLPRERKFSFLKLQNKLLVRELLHEKLNYDLPKKGFEFDLVEFIRVNKKLLFSEITANPLFENIDAYLEQLYGLLLKKEFQYVAKRKIQLLFQFSAFINRHQHYLR